MVTICVWIRHMVIICEGNACIACHHLYWMLQAVSPPSRAMRVPHAAQCGPQVGVSPARRMHRNVSIILVLGGHMVGAPLAEKSPK